MFYEILAAFAAFALLLIAIPILRNSIVVTNAYLKFKKGLKGIRMLDKFSPIDGHLRLLFKPFLIHELSELSQKYGKTVGFMFVEHPAVFTHDLDLIKRVIVDEKANDRLELKVPVQEARYDSIFLTNGEKWRRIRRAIAPALKSNKFKAPNCLREIEGSINKLVDSFEWRFAQTDGKTNHIEVDIYDLAHRYALDLALSCLYKQNKSIDFRSKRDFMTKTVDDGLESILWNPFIRYSMTFTMFASIADWLMLHFHIQGTWRKTLMGFIKQQTDHSLEARRQIEASKVLGKNPDEDNFLLKDGNKFNRNLVDHIIDHYSEGKISAREYYHSTWSLLSASDKTSADGITHTIYQLAIHGEIQEKLRKSIKLQGIESEYLSWVISESMRILPPSVIGCSRLIKNEIKLDNGCVIPANTSIITPAYSIHRLKEYWGDDVEAFKPERFADTSKFHPFQYIPFGAGARICPGKDFALFEIKMLIASLLSKYRFHCEPIKQRYSSPTFTYTVQEIRTMIKITRLNEESFAC